MKIGTVKKKTKKKTPAKARSPRKKAVKDDVPSVVDIAKNAVNEYHVKKELYYDARDSFGSDYPEAQEALVFIDSLKDEASVHLTKAKNAVVAAKQTIEEFKFVHPKSSPGFSGTKLMDSLVKLADDESFEALGEVFHELVRRGVITSVGINKDAAKIVHTTHVGPPADVLGAAWDKGGVPGSPHIRGAKLE